MKIVSFFESDYNFSAKLSKICDLESDELFFLDKFDLLNQFKGSQNVLLIIDFNDYKENLELVIDSIKNIGNFTVCILIDTMNSKVQKQATKIGFDIIMSKAIFLMNIKAIKQQLSNTIKKS